MRKEDAFNGLAELQANGVILLEGTAIPEQVSLDDWDPVGRTAWAENVSGVVIRYLASGTRHFGKSSGGAALDRLDLRNALALARRGRHRVRAHRER
jgi:hypothetical protein